MSHESLDALLGRMVELGASDIFLTVGAPPTVSVEKRLVAIDGAPLERADLGRLAAPLLARARADFATHPDLDLAHATEAGRFRLSVLRQKGELAIVGRRVSATIPSLEELGLPDFVGRAALELRGLFLITGAAATGKSTTLASMIDRRNATAPGHIVLVEDPIEFLHEHKRSIVTQREVGIDTGSFHEALRAAVRHAPDVLAIGEVRDPESALAALRFAETGHLVLATLHATNTTQAIERFTSLFPQDLERQALLQLSLGLLGIVSQRLLARSDAPRRTLACEVLEPTQRVRDAIRRGDLVAVRAALAEGGGAMQSFDEALRRLVLAGKVLREDAVRYADSPSDFALAFRLQEATAPGRTERRRLRLI